MTEATPTDAIADNAIVDKSKFVTDDALANINLPPYLRRDFESAAYMDSAQGMGCGVVRVNVDSRSGGIGLSVALEDGDTEFNVSAMPLLDAEQALALSDAIRETVEGMQE